MTEWPGTLGTSDGTIDVPGRAKMSYVTLVDGSIVEAWRGNIPPIPDLPVIVGQERPKARLKILRYNDVFPSPPAFPEVGEHAETHRYLSPTGGYDPLYVELRQFMPLRVEAAGGYSINVYSGIVRLDGEWLQYTGTGATPIDLTASIPTSGARWVLVSIYNNAGMATIATTNGTQRALNLLTVADIPTTPDDHRPLAAVRLYLGQLAITESRQTQDILDLRMDSGIDAIRALTLDMLIFSTNYAPTGSEAPGTMYWNSDDETIDIVMPNDIINQVALEEFFDYENQTGSTILDGSALMYSGTLGASGRITAQLAIADGSLSPAYTIGIATHDCPDGEMGKATWRGKVRQVDTTGTPYSETWSDGDLIWVSPTTAGDLTNVKPVAPHRAILVAVVIKAHSNGTLLVRPTWSPKMTELDDVDGRAPVAGDLLVYNGTIWTPALPMIYDDEPLYLDGDQVYF